MNIAELKLDLIKSICSIEDISILEKIKDILLIENKEGAYILSDKPLSSVNEAMEQYENGQFLTKEEEVHIFTPEQRKRILNSLQQCKEGNVMTDEEADADIQKWL